MLYSIWRRTFYPYRVYLPLSQTDSARLDLGMPNIVVVPVRAGASPTERIDAALAECDAEYAAVIPEGFEVREFWLEDSLHALINNPNDRGLSNLKTPPTDSGPWF